MKDEVNILLVDDQPAKLLSYEVMLQEVGENLIKASSAREALEQLLKREIAILLVDVCTGSRLQASSAIGNSLLVAARFRGIGVRACLMVEPTAGLEPATYGLRNRCSTD